MTAPRERADDGPAGRMPWLEPEMAKPWRPPSGCFTVAGTHAGRLER
ncbi:MAG: hypothetical protein AB1330_02265 [Bacillota bacterium]